jgi:hypothetical protein
MRKHCSQICADYYIDVLLWRRINSYYKNWFMKIENLHALEGLLKKRVFPKLSILNTNYLSFTKLLHVCMVRYGTLLCEKKLKYQVPSR